MTSTYLTRPQAIDPATVKGWGVDADPRNDPTYPYRQRGDDPGPAKDWERRRPSAPRWRCCDPSSTTGCRPWWGPPRRRGA